MKLFNGVLVVASVQEAGLENPAISWEVEAQFTSVEGFYKNEVQKGDIVFLKGYCMDDDSTQFCRYIVTSCGLTEDKKRLKLSLDYGEEFVVGDNVYAPADDEEHKTGMIGRMTSENGFTVLPTVQDGFATDEVQTARNIDLKIRDEKLLLYIQNKINEAIVNVGSASDKLPIAGGTITGDLAVQGTTELKNTKVTSGSNVVEFTTNGMSVDIQNDNPEYAISVTSANKVTTSEVKASSNNDVVDTKSVTGLNATVTTNINASKTGKLETLVKGTDTANIVTNANGLVSDIQINSNGSSNAKVSVLAQGTNGEINLTANQIKLNGKVIGNDTIIAQKLYQTDSLDSFEDNQLITEKHLKSYVSGYVDEKVGAATDLSKIQEQIDSKADSDDTYTMNQVDSLLQTMKAANLTTDSTHRFVTDTQTDAWNNKQDALGYVAEDINKRGVASGYAPLDENAKISEQFLYEDTTPPQIGFSFKNSFLEMVATNKCTSKIYFVMDENKSENAETIDNYQIFAIQTVTEDDIVDDPTLELGVQKAYALGKYSADVITTDWLSIDNKPDLVILNTDKTIDDEILPPVGMAGSYNRVTTDKYGRVVAGANEVIKVDWENVLGRPNLAEIDSETNKIDSLIVPDKINILKQSVFEAKLAESKLEGELFFVIPDDADDEEKIVTNYKTYLVKTEQTKTTVVVPETESHNELGEITIIPEHEEVQIVVTQKSFSLEKKIDTDWENITNKPNVAVLDTDDKITDESLKDVVTAGTYNSITVDAKGRVIAGTVESYSGGGGGTADSIAWDKVTDKPSIAELDVNGKITDTVLKDTVTAGTYNSVTVDEKGRVTAGTNEAVSVDWADVANKPDLVNLDTNKKIADTSLKSVTTAGTYNSVTVDEFGRVTAGTNEATGGSSGGSGGEVWKWRKSDDGNIIYDGNGDGVTIEYGSGIVNIYVPQGVRYRSAQFKIPYDKVTSMGSASITINYDVNHAFTFSEPWFATEDDDTEVFSTTLSPAPIAYLMQGTEGAFIKQAGAMQVVGNNKFKFTGTTAKYYLCYLTI